MKFMIIGRATKDTEAGVPPTTEALTKMGQHFEELMKAGVLLGAEGLLPSSKGARVRLSGGKLTVTDGPFTEAKELIGGFAILQADSKEEAIEMTKRFLGVHAEVLGSSYEAECEVRQMFDPADCAPNGSGR